MEPPALKTLLNFQVAPYDIITMRDEGTRRPMTAIVNGKCRSQHPISAVTHATRVTAPNHHEDYQRAITANEKVFRRTNGPFTEWFDRLQNQRFISVPFKDAQRPPAGLK